VDGVKHWLDGVWEFDPAAGKWTQQKKLSAPLAYAAFAEADHGLFMMGGTDGKTVTRQVLRWTPEGQKIVGSLPQPLMYAGAAAVGDEIYMVGGSADATDWSHLSDALLRINSVTGEVSDLPAIAGGPRILPAVAAAGGMIFVFGGSSDDSSSGQIKNLDAARAYSSAEQKWKSIRSFPSARRGMTACALDEDHILIGGGYGQNPADGSAQGFADELFVYSIREDRYRQVEKLPYAALGVGMARDGQTLYVFGGEDQNKHRSDKMMRCDWKELLKAAKD